MAAKTQTSTAPVLSPARLQLQQILEAQQRAGVLVDKAQKVVEAASAAVDKAWEDSAKYEKQAEDAVASRLAILKGEPGKSAAQLREASRNRLLAKEELMAADETLRAAERELQESHDNVARAQKACNSHATAVISECATDVIAEWDRLSLERERLRTILRAFILVDGHLDALPAQQQASILESAAVKAGLPWGDYRDYKHLQNKVGAALSRNYAQPDPGPGMTRAMEFWAQFAASLLADPAAEQAPLPSADSLFG
jgi:hypothetical protein